MGELANVCASLLGCVYCVRHDINPKTHRVSATVHVELDCIQLSKKHPNSDGGQDCAKHQVEPSCAFVSAKFVSNLVPYSGLNRKRNTVVKREYSRNSQNIRNLQPPVL